MGFAYNRCKPFSRNGKGGREERKENMQAPGQGGPEGAAEAPPPPSQRAGGRGAVAPRLQRASWSGKYTDARAPRPLAWPPAGAGSSGWVGRRGVGGGAGEERAALCAAAAAGRGRRAPLSERGAPLLGRASSAGGCAAARGAGRVRDLARPSRAGSAAGCPQHAAAGAARGQGGQHGGCQSQIYAAPAGICCGGGARGACELGRGSHGVQLVSRLGSNPPRGGPLAFRGRQTD